MSGSRFPSGALAIACATLALAIPSLAHAKCHASSLEMPVTMIGTRAVATVGIDGTTIPLTVDSGASFSMLTDAIAAQLDLRATRTDRLRVSGITGSVDAKITTVGKLTLLDGDASNVQFIVGGNEPGAGTMGLMGRNVLSLTDTEYDLAHGAIRFLFPNDECGRTGMAYWADSSPVNEVELIRDYRSKTPALRARVKLNGVEVTALFDTGATTVVSASAARRAGIADTDLKRAGVMYGAGRGRAQAWTARFERVELGSEVVAPTRLPVGDFELPDADMLVGIDFFLSHRIYVSKDQSKMFITSNGGPVFALDGGAVRPDAAARAEGSRADPDTVTADDFARRGAASAARRDFDGALADLDRACELAPTSAAFFAQRAGVQEALKRPAKALEDLDRALVLDPRLADARLRRASLRFDAKDRDGAIADLDVLDGTLPPQSQMRLALSLFFLRLDSPSRALVQLNQWLPAHPNEVRREVALNNRCWARVRLDVELDGALDDCNDALDVDPKNPVFLGSRGWAHWRRGDDRKAVADFDRSLAARPGYAWSLYGRGLAETRLGDAARGEADLASARQALPSIDAAVRHAGLMSEVVK